MALQLYTLPSGKVMKLHPAETRMLDAIMDDPDHVRADLQEVYRPKGMSTRTMYALAGMGALVRLNTVDDTYLYAKCFWGTECPHEIGHGADATRADRLPPSRGVQSAIGAAIAAGWVDTLHDPDNRTITFERPHQTVDVRFGVHGAMLEVTASDVDIYRATMQTFLDVLRSPPIQTAVFTSWVAL